MEPCNYSRQVHPIWRRGVRAPDEIPLEMFGLRVSLHSKKPATGNSAENPCACRGTPVAGSYDAWPRCAIRSLESYEISKAAKPVTNDTAHHDYLEWDLQNEKLFVAGLGRHLVKTPLAMAPRVSLSMNANPNSSFRSLPRPCRLLASCWPDSLLHANQVEGHRPLARIHRDVEVAAGGLWTHNSNQAEASKSPKPQAPRLKKVPKPPEAHITPTSPKGKRKNHNGSWWPPGAISAAPPALSAACGPAGVRQMTSLEQ